MRSILFLVAVRAIGAVVVVALAGPGTRFGWRAARVFRIRVGTGDRFGKREAAEVLMRGPH